MDRDRRPPGDARYGARKERGVLNAAPGTVLRTPVTERAAPRHSFARIVPHSSRGGSHERHRESDARRDDAHAAGRRRRQRTDAERSGIDAGERVGEIQRTANAGTTRPGVTLPGGENRAGAYCRAAVNAARPLERLVRDEILRHCGLTTLLSSLHPVVFADAWIFTSP